ncbi:MAG TPA: hypothetical protein VL442_20665 [Mucilaginibacter sp.]|nr:hypothetical protein [Mucilaginibacter sp.]
MKLKDYQINGMSDLFIKDQIDIGNFKAILLDGTPQGAPKKEGYKNLLAIDELNNIVWIAEIPKSWWSSYQMMEYKNGELIALSGSFLCTINIITGEILSERFSPWS